MGSRFSSVRKAMMTRDKPKIQMFVMRQRENTADSTSSVDIFDDDESGRSLLQSKIGENFTRLFDRKGISCYRAENLTMSSFISLISSIKSNSWTISGTNAYFDVNTNEVITTFYFENSSLPGGVNHASSSSADTRGLHASNVASTAVASRSRPFVGLTGRGSQLSSSAASTPAAKGLDSAHGIDKGAQYLNVFKNKSIAKSSGGVNEQASNLIEDKLPSSNNDTLLNETNYHIVDKNAPPQPPVTSILAELPEDSSSADPQSVGLAESIEIGIIDSQDEVRPAQACSSSAYTSVRVDKEAVDRPSTDVADPAQVQVSQAVVPTLASVTFPTPRAVSSPARASTTALDEKNAAFFKKKREEEETKKKLEAEKESRMDPASLAVLRETREQQQQHDANKTAHYSRLGENFVATREATGGKGPAHVLATGKGRGAGIVSNTGKL